MSISLARLLSSSSSGVVGRLKMLEGWAIRITPTNATIPAKSSFLVKTWPRKIEQAQAVTMGTRKRKTVASARGR